MKIVVIGGSGLVGQRLVSLLQARGQEVVVATSSRGVNAVTGAGLDVALAGAEVVVDVINPKTFDNEQEVLEFFQTSSGNLIAAELKAGVKHHVVLSIVGTDRRPVNAYFKAKIAQEKLVELSNIPYTILRATQFFEFLDFIAAASTEEHTVRLSTAMFQPVAVDDVAATLADIALAAPVNGIVEIAGPERMSMAEIIKRHLTSLDDPRRVVADSGAGYFGVPLNEGSLVPDNDHAIIGSLDYEEWAAKCLHRA